MLSKIKSWIKQKSAYYLHLRGMNSPLFNLNYDPNLKQQRVAFVYLSNLHNSLYERDKIHHPNVFQHYMLLQTFINKGFVIDVYNCQSDDVNIKIENTNVYDIIFGFGRKYLELCSMNPKAKKILFITENAPWVVRKKYQERLDYWKSNHNRMIKTIARNEFYTDEMFKVSDSGVCLSGTYNISGMLEQLKPIEQLYVNVLPGVNHFKINKKHDITKKRFLWFGSRGLIHKGLDILIDAFTLLPQFELDIYGAPESEIKELNLPANVHNCGYIKVDSNDFIEKVISQHSFVLSLSCSEGMMSGIATCMMYGLIPIVTLETGYDDCPYAFIFKDWHVDSVKEQIEKCGTITNDQLEIIEEKVKSYAQITYTNENFKNTFSTILDKLTLNN